MHVLGSLGSSDCVLRDLPLSFRQSVEWCHPSRRASFDCQPVPRSSLSELQSVRRSEGGKGFLTANQAAQSFWRGNIFTRCFAVIQLDRIHFVIDIQALLIKLFAILDSAILSDLRHNKCLVATAEISDKPSHEAVETCNLVLRFASKLNHF